MYIARKHGNVGLSYANHYDITNQDAVKSIAEKRNYIQDKNHFLEHEFTSSWGHHIA